MIQILDATKSLSVLAADTSNGLGFVRPISATVTEELNGIYELEAVVSTDEKRYGELEVGGIIRTKAGETSGAQMFRIYELSVPMNGRVTIKASHISYDLNKIAVTPFTATGAANVCTGLVSNALNNSGFTMTTDISNTASAFTLEIPRYFRECLGGWEGSVLDVFRGEYEWDNLEVKMLTRRGADNGVRIAYGKNLTDFRQEENNEAVYTSVLGYAVWNDTTYTGNIYHKVVATDPKIKIVDFSNQYDQNTEPTAADLTTKAQAYATANDIEIPKVNLEVKFVPLWQADEYRWLSNIPSIERVSLGDTVHIDFPKLNVSASARVVRTVWNIVKDRYDSVELGSVKSTLSGIVAKNETAITQVGNVTTSLQGQVEDMAAALTETDRWIAKHYRLSGNSSVTLNMNTGGYMCVLFAQRSQASTGQIFMLESYTANYTTFGSGNITITQNSTRVFTVTNTGSQNITLLCLGGSFS